jgi:hypothetical protein
VGEVINFAANGCEAFAPFPHLGVNQFVHGLQKSTQTAESDAYKKAVEVADKFCFLII